MKQPSIIAGLFFAAAVFAFGQTADKKESGGQGKEQLLIQLKRDWGKTYVQRDAAALEKLLGDEYFVTDESGQTTSRAEIMSDFKSSQAVYEATSYDDAKVTFYNDVAIVAGRGTVKGRGKNGSFHRQYFSTNVFVKRDGRWQAVATHISGVKSL